MRRPPAAYTPPLRASKYKIKKRKTGDAATPQPPQVEASTHQATAAEQQPEEADVEQPDELPSDQPALEPADGAETTITIDSLQQQGNVVMVDWHMQQQQQQQQQHEDEQPQQQQQRDEATDEAITEPADDDEVIVEVEAIVMSPDSTMASCDVTVDTGAPDEQQQQQQQQQQQEQQQQQQQQLMIQWSSAPLDEIQPQATWVMTEKDHEEMYGTMDHPLGSQQQQHGEQQLRELGETDGYHEDPFGPLGGEGPAREEAGTPEVIVLDTAASPEAAAQPTELTSPPASGGAYAAPVAAGLMNRHAEGMGGRTLDVTPDGSALGQVGQVEQGSYRSIDQLADVAKPAIIDQIFEAMHEDARADMLLGGMGTSQVSLERRTARAKDKLLACSVDKLRAIKRGLSFLNWMAAQEQWETTYPADEAVMVETIAEYMTLSMGRSVERAQQRVLQGKSPVRSGAGGATAAKPIFDAFQTLHKKLGLHGYCISDAVRDAYAHPKHAPAVKAMMGLDLQCILQQLSQTGIGWPSLGPDDPAEPCSHFEKAYAGGLALLAPAVARLRDFQRTAAIETIEVDALGIKCRMVRGIATKSKALTQMQMMPLEWRAHLTSLCGDEHEIDTTDLKLMMSHPNNKAVFRDFEVPAGRPHVITEAIAWKDQAAIGDIVVKSGKALLHRAGCNTKRVEKLGSHEGRHVIPEVSKRLKVIPKERREAVGNWRIAPTIHDDPTSVEALAEAYRLARHQAGERARIGALASQADRYASADSCPIVQDEDKLLCTQAVREAWAKWDAGEGVPATTRQQLIDIGIVFQQQLKDMGPAQA